MAEALQAGADVVAVYHRADLGALDRFSGKWIVESVSSTQMEQISGLANASPVLAVLSLPVVEPNVAALAQERVLVLDTIRDPGNLGTIIRTADWFGLKHVLASKDTVDLFNPKVVQSTMGSMFRVQVHYVDIEEAVAKLKQENPAFKIWGAVLDGTTSRELAATQDPGALVIGNEANGISDEVMAQLDERVTIPGKGGAESLNAAVSASILLYEWMTIPQS